MISIGLIQLLYETFSWQGERGVNAEKKYGIFSTVKTKWNYDTSWEADGSGNFQEQDCEVETGKGWEGNRTHVI